jgi:hypothetical protein
MRLSLPDGSTLTSLKWQVAEILSTTEEIVHPLEIIVVRIEGTAI